MGMATALLDLRMTIVAVGWGGEVFCSGCYGLISSPADPCGCDRRDLQLSALSLQVVGGFVAEPAMTEDPQL